jgi:tetratricopeptide (TPR) repeat protein
MALAVESMSEAVRRDPYSVSHRRDLSRLNLMRAQLRRSTGSDATPATGAEQFAAAVSAAKEAVRLYPRDPHGLVDLGDCLLHAGEATRSADWIREAIDSYERALELDDARLTWETIRRFRDHEKAGIAANLDRARRILDDVE